MNPASNLLNRRFVAFLTALGENTSLSAIRAGMVAVVPLTIIGGLFMIVTSLPVPGWDAWINPHLQLLQLPVTATFGLLAVFVCFAIGYDLGKQLKQEAVVSASMATLVFLLIQIENRVPAEFSGDDLADAPALAARLRSPAREIDRFLAGQLSPATRTALEAFPPGATNADTAPLQAGLLADLNRLLGEPSLRDSGRFAGVALRLETRHLLGSAILPRPAPEGDDLRRLNRHLLEDAYPAELARNQHIDHRLSMAGLGSQGLFTAILVALVVVRVQKFFGDRNLVIKLPDNVPSVVYESFLSLSPMVFLIVAFWTLRYVLGVDINAVVQTAFSPLVFALNTLPGILVYAFAVTLLWSVGINGDNAMDALVAPVFLQYLAANVEAVAQGQPMPYITALGFFTTFVNVGGTGATIALALVMLNSKEPGFRKVSRVSLPTQIFQINEPIFFGFPIVLNPVFMVPYILNALLLTAGSYLLMHWNLIQKPFVSVPWTTPPIIGHYLVSGGDWRAALWGVASLLLAMAVYYPFARTAERQRLRTEAAHAHPPA